MNKISHVIYYASRTLSDAQKIYSTVEKELLVVVFALDKFCSYLLFSKWLHTDHAALGHLFAKKDTKPRLIRWILLLHKFDFKIKDKKGSKNLVANHLSKIFLEYTNDLVEFSEHFLDEQLFVASHTPLPWFTHIVNYLTTRKIPLH